MIYIREIFFTIKKKFSTMNKKSSTIKKKITTAQKTFRKNSKSLNITQNEKRTDVHNKNEVVINSIKKRRR